MPVELNFTIEGEKQLARRIQTLDREFKDLKPEFQESVNFLKGFFSGEVFDTRGRAIGEPWKPTGNKWPILERTGRMRRSFQAKAEPLRGEV